MTAQQVADYYEVGIKAIQSCFYDNRDEIREDGVVKYTPKMLKNLNLLKGETEKARYVTEIKLSDDVILRVPNAGINLFSKRTILRKSEQNVHSDPIPSVLMPDGWHHNGKRPEQTAPASLILCGHPFAVD